MQYNDSAQIPNCTPL